MPSFDKIKMNGVIVKKKGNGFFDVEISDESGFLPKNAHVLCRLCGKMRNRNINVVEGDSVDVDVSIVDPKKGIIIYRSKKPRG